ncbi:BAR adaptor protein Hob1 [Mycoemilia scoparia]|uniref:BAR adaptor protein Hob1 n=1 Tax=Mycoemilia scoparia TaxID=417184 RepID=A0A9W8A1M3_9FUNG|nr:BAR adaptor protein Hob1 [Mycoemilia scoparia]
MSWKGFKKAMERLPHQVTSKMGKGSKTIDDDYEVQRERFKDIETIIKKIFEDASKFRDGITNALKYQENFLQLIKDLYCPIIASSNGGKVTDAAGGPEQRQPIQNREASPEMIQAAQQLFTETNQLQNEVMPHLQKMEERVVYPLQEVLAMMKNVRRVMDKRDHKLIDFDRFKNSVTKLEAKGNEGGRSLSDEKSYHKNMAQYQESERQYNYYNDMLKTELEQFFSLVQALADPIFLSFFRIQQEIYMTMYRLIDQIVKTNPKIDGSRPVVSGWMDRWSSSEATLRGLDLWDNGFMETKPYNPGKSGFAGSIGRTFKRSNTGSKGGATAAAGPSPLPPAPTSHHHHHHHNAAGTAAGVGAAASAVGGSGPIPAVKMPSIPSSTGSGHYQPPPYEAVVPGRGSTPNFGGYGSDHKSPIPQNVATPPAAHAHTNRPPPVAATASVPQPPPPPPQPQAPQYVIALYDYDAQAEGDLTFKENDRIEIVNRTNNNNDWWTGKLNGTVGIFPANYVRDI